MPLENLLELVETLNNRIDKHGAALRQSEALTRAALIDPLLRELGWDTEDPALVIPEYRSSAGSADYALMSGADQPPSLIIEAKKLGEPLDDRVALQSLNYCNLIGTPHFALTDGKSWKIYATFEQAPLADRLIATFNIGDMPAAEVCLQALALWRPAIEQDSVMAANKPIVGLDAVKREASESVGMPTREAETAPQIQPTTRQAHSAVTQSGETSQEWIPLSDLSPQGGDTPPVEIQFPDNSKVALGRWNTVVVESVRWLYTNNCLNANNWRIQRASRYLVADSPIHPNGKEFTMPSNIGSLYVEVNYSALNHVKNACIIIQRARQDPAQFKVRLSS